MSTKLWASLALAIACLLAAATAPAQASLKAQLFRYLLQPSQHENRSKDSHTTVKQNECIVAAAIIGIVGLLKSLALDDSGHSPHRNDHRYLSQAVLCGLSSSCISSDVHVLSFAPTDKSA